MWPALSINRGIFGAVSSFCVGQHSARGGGIICFSGVFFFQGRFASIGKIVILVGELGTRISFYEDLGVC